jgi:hypothetical protein
LLYFSLYYPVGLSLLAYCVSYGLSQAQRIEKQIGKLIKRMKTFILLKPLPDAEPKTKLFLQDGYYYYKSIMEEDKWFSKYIVENSPEWFKESHQ